MFFYSKFTKSYFEISVDKENEIIIETESHVDIDDVKRKYNEKFLNGNNKSMKEIARSRYALYNIIFMRMYERLKAIDDIHEYDYQIYIEEYLYDMEHQKVLSETS